MSVENVLELLTGIALFLFGMSLMGEGLKQVAGNKLEVILYKLTGSPLKGSLFGAGITAVIQSSSATSVMVVGFVNSGLMKLYQAIPVVLGAIFGTSITGWVICLSELNGASGLTALLSTSTLTCAAALVGIFLRMFSKNRFKNHLGSILLGFAVLMFGMSAMSGAVSPLKESAAFIGILTKFSNPVIGVLVGIAFTSILQSASAAVGILQALSIAGVISFSIALPLIMGIGIGAAVPVLLSAIGATREGKCTAFAYLICNVLGAAIVAVVFYALNAAFSFSFMNLMLTTVSIAILNSVYRLIVVALLLPLVKQIEKIALLLVSSKNESVQEKPELLPLEERFINHPALAIEQSRNAVNDMANKAQENLFLAFELLQKYSPEQYEQAQMLEELVDSYEDKLGTYLLKITSKELDSMQNASVGKILHTITDFERISDHAVNLADTAKELFEQKKSFSGPALHEVDVIGAAVREIVTESFHAFLTNDLQLAGRIEALEEVIGDLCGEAKLHHVERLQGGLCSFSAGFAFNDIMTSFERVADHCSNIAVAMIAIESDSFDTHEYINSVKQLKHDTFAEYLEEYSQKYAF